MPSTESGWGQHIKQALWVWPLFSASAETTAMSVTPDSRSLIISHSFPMYILISISGYCPCSSFRALKNRSPPSLVWKAGRCPENSPAFLPGNSQTVQAPEIRQIKPHLPSQIHPFPQGSCPIYGNTFEYPCAYPKSAWCSLPADTFLGL